MKKRVSSWAKKFAPAQNERCRRSNDCCRGCCYCSWRSSASRLLKLGRVESLIKGKDGLVPGAVVKSTTPKKRNPTRLRRPLQRLYPLERGARSQGDSTADIQMCLLELSTQRCSPDGDVLDGADDAEERPRREAARRVDKERRALMENKLLWEHWFLSFENRKPFKGHIEWFLSSENSELLRTLNFENSGHLF